MSLLSSTEGDDEYEIISAVICLIQLKTLHVTLTNQDDKTYKRLSMQGSWPGYSVSLAKRLSDDVHVWHPLRMAQPNAVQDTRFYIQGRMQ